MNLPFEVTGIGLLGYILRRNPPDPITDFVSDGIKLASFPGISSRRGWDHLRSHDRRAKRTAHTHRSRLIVVRDQRSFVTILRSKVVQTSSQANIG